MFSKLRRNMVLTILFASLLFTTTLGVVSFVLFTQSLSERYERSALESIRQKIVHSEFSVENVKNSSRQLSENPFFIEGLGEEGYNHQIPPMLNTLKSNAFGVLAATVYTEGHMYSTFNISQIPDFETLRNYGPIADFLASEKTSFLSIRTTHIAQIYNNVHYDPDFGMLTYIVKLTDKDESLVGVLFVDISPTYLYNTFFNYADHAGFENVLTFMLGDDDAFLKSTAREAPAGLSGILEDPRQDRFLQDGTLVYVEPFLTDSHWLVTVVPRAPLQRTLLMTALALTGMVVVLNVVAYAVANRMARSVGEPLSQLKLKMDKTRIRTKT